MMGIFFLYACKNNADDEQVAIDTVQTEGDVVEAEINELQQSFPSLFTYLESQDSTFTASGFTESETSSLSQNKTFPMEEGAQAFYSYFIYNADSSLAIDLYSNNYLIRERAGKQTLQRGGPDTEITLVNVKNKTEQRLLFTGPSVSILEAKWLSANEMMIAGAEEMGNERVKPMLWKINLQDSTIQLYAYPDTLRVTTQMYAEDKLNQKPL